jgi:hypothetical protein
MPDDIPRKPPLGGGSPEAVATIPKNELAAVGPEINFQVTQVVQGRRR